MPASKRIREPWDSFDLNLERRLLIAIRNNSRGRFAL